MEWAERNPVLPGLLEAWQVTANHADDILVGAVDNVLRNQFAAHFCKLKKVGSLIAGMRPRVLYV